MAIDVFVCLLLCTELASQSQAQAASSGGGSSSQGAQMDSPFIDRR